MIDEDEEYSEWVADVILSYFASQLQSGRTVIYESEIWQLLGQELPADQENRMFRLKDYADKTDNNVVDLSEYRKKLH